MLTVMATVTISVYQNNNEHMKSYQKFYGRVKHEDIVDVKVLCNHAARDSGIEEAEVSTSFDAILKQIQEQLCLGRPIKVEELGTLKIGFHSDGVSAADVQEKHPDFDPTTDDIRKYLVASRQVKNPHLIFTPSDDIRNNLREVKFHTDKSDWADHLNNLKNGKEDNNG